MRKAAAFVVVLALYSAVFAQSTTTTPAPGTNTSAPRTTSDNVPFEKAFKSVVFVIKLQCEHTGSSVESFEGTGFAVALPDERLGPGGGFGYLVTNRHVAECWDEDRHPMNVKSISVRVTLSDGSAGVVPINQHGNAEWIFPSGDSVDLAILPLGLSQDQVRFKVIALPLFVTSDQISSGQVHEGQRIVFTGFFPTIEGERTMQPIMREGMLAMLPEEDVINTTGKRGKVYLGDVHVLGGNSGSPVMVDLGGAQGNKFIAGYDYHLLGVVSGYYFEDSDLTLRVATNIKGKVQANSGIAIIVPASEIKDLLEDPRVRAQRDAQAARLKTATK